ncbi:hemerythrin family protein [Undibacterium jejuense]|uniref:Hemerythrin family protein n=1 Tax=Undibacterium jejuense TaxID=1344949 RepID=A0A923HH58_9BURK|nr:hemerythrin family protein [Undibacterium jejuense]MBC3861557.1 hemerythrin family protein [Undibacterium jejuense]
MYIHWEKTFVLNNDLIDTQHRILILLYRKLDIAIKANESRQTILRIMLEMKKFTEFHFVSEENLMHEIAYPDVDQHALVHTELLKRIESMLVKINRQQEFPEDLLYFLNEWISDHILHEDLKIANYVKSAVRRPIGEHLYEQYLLLEEK